MPSPGRRWAGRQTGSCRLSSKRMLPPLAGKMPVTTLKIVVLPEPFGPINPTISPLSIRKSKFWTACNPPKFFFSAAASKSAIGGGRRSGSLLAHHRLDELEPGPLHLVDVERRRRNVAFVIERDALAEDALIALVGAHRITDRNAVRLADLLHRLKDDVGRLVSELSIGAELPVLALVPPDELNSGPD